MSPSGPARLAYLGTSDFAATVLRRLAESPHRPAIVVTPPDRRRGRGRRLGPPPAAEAAQDLALPLHQTEDANSAESIAALEDAGVEVGLVCAFGQYLRRPILERFELLNVHPSLLPRWRGAAPIERAIMAGDERTGVAIIRVTEELDAGPVALVESLAIEPGDYFGSLAPRLAELAGELAVRALDLHATGELTFTPQGDDGMTYAEKIDPSERALDCRRPAVELERTVRALHPHIGAYLELDGGDRLGVGRVEIQEGEPPPPGEVRAAADALVVGCDPGALRILSVRPPGRRGMPAPDYLRGHPAPHLADPQ